MAISRDGGNLFTEERMEEIRARMKQAEETTVEHDGNIYTWQDLCASNNAGEGTVYEFPCVRLSPMDFFQEARWFFDEQDRVTWHEKIVKESLVKPLIPRFGIMTGVCSNPEPILDPSEADQKLPCHDDYYARVSPDFAESIGLPREYANPLSLFADINNMEKNDECAICIEQGYQETIDSLEQAIPGAFGIMAMELVKLNATLTEPVEKAQVLTIAGMAGQLAQTMTREAVEDFWFYYVTRGLYASLGAQVRD